MAQGDCGAAESKYGKCVVVPDLTGYNGIARPAHGVERERTGGTDNNQYPFHGAFGIPHKLNAIHRYLAP